MSNRYEPGSAAADEWLILDGDREVATFRDGGERDVALNALNHRPDTGGVESLPPLHRVDYPWGSVTFWRRSQDPKDGFVAANANDPWTYAETQAYGLGLPLTFPRNRFEELKRYCWHMNHAFHAGRRQRSKELQRLLMDC